MTEQVQATCAEDIATMSFEAALAGLEKIVRQLEDGRGQLDQSIAAYERGALLRAHCQRKLEEARLKVERISLDGDGAAKIAPFDDEGGAADRGAG
jgi:exodeoxyribonuclease VII small subunit